LHLAICLSNLYMRCEARPDSPLRERGKVYKRFKRGLIEWRSPASAKELIVVFNHNAINTLLQIRALRMPTSYYDKAYELL